MTYSLVKEWKNYGDKKLFKKDELELKKIADILLNLEDKTTFFNELKEYFKDKQGVPTFPVDTTDDYQKTDYFFTLSPHYVIGFSATYQIKHDSAKKKEMEDNTSSRWFLKLLLHKNQTAVEKIYHISVLAVWKNSK